ncbi:4'-phosphopantetheinyl transferase superfamily protein [Maridesulfovibrio sp.]|uniref:4'-phosphopantetheinyl transferase family protein n=1 Tax=Maridesulfovibrio sp. TaxID=2795000 RepID=UPI0029C9C20C|nr:4'-phosphopantetheinyl transferase superfamily protein [Maridesulfovibrio sp.]
MNNRPNRLIETALEFGCDLSTLFQPAEGVDIIVVRLPEDRCRLLKQGHILSPQERSRAGKYKFARHREKYTARRVLLRLWLAGELSEPPHEIRIGYTSHGKLFLGQQKSNPPLTDFNMSHSSNSLALAIHRTGRIGIDIEYERTQPDIITMLETICTPEEFRFLKSLSLSEMKSACYQLWTAKEAYLKAIGVGLSQNPNSVNLQWDIHGDTPKIEKNSLPGWRFTSDFSSGLHLCVCWENDLMQENINY